MTADLIKPDLSKKIEGLEPVVAPSASGRGALPTPSLEVGKTYEQWWPFRRENYGTPDSIVPTWVPGFQRETEGDSYSQHHYFTFDGEGVELRTIVSIHTLPKPYKPRVFYRRQWRDPEGKAFGNGKLLMAVEQAFRNWLGGKKVEFLEDDRSENAEREHYGILIPHAASGADGQGPIAAQTADDASGMNPIPSQGLHP